ncbi:MAG: IS21 family transposase [Candidatus Omnitrophica bacterium]|nr:IS21 family transposase [Candidatus Omnitrophota bacterium]
MDTQSLLKMILHLREVERLSLRQIGKELGICRNRVSRILRQSNISAKPIVQPRIIEPYKALISEWYRERPYLKAIQVYERLQSYGFKGSYPTVIEYTKKYRGEKVKAYHTLDFLPGQEAQVDWFYFTHENLGKVYGFLYLLSYSRYAWGRFYPKTSFEFFLDGHIQCFEHLKGLAHTHRYDNLKSVVLKRYPSIEYNPQFMDFARFYGFSIYLCNPYSGNEKGRVERPIRDIRSFLYAEDFKDMNDLNHKYHAYLSKRNSSIHRSTGKPPKELLGEENLLKVPLKSYPPTRVIPGVSISKQALVEFESNKYSVPSVWAGKSCEIVAWPERIEVWAQAGRIAVHRRSFDRKKLFQNPLHTERLLRKSPQFKMQRIYQLIQSMNPALKVFLLNQEDETIGMECAYHLFKLLKSHSRGMLISCVRELNNMKCFKLKALLSLLKLPQLKENDPVWPKDTNLLNLNYEERSLNDYDELS